MVGLRKKRLPGRLTCNTLGCQGHHHTVHVPPSWRKGKGRGREEGEERKGKGVRGKGIRKKEKGKRGRGRGRDLLEISSVLCIYCGCTLLVSTDILAVVWKEGEEEGGEV